VKGDTIADRRHYLQRVTRASTIVVGAGLSGLACAFDLARAGRDVVVLEAGPRAGGVVGAIEREGFRFETGPNTIQASAAAFRTLCGDLGIAERLIVSPPEQRDRFVFVRGRMRALPSTPLEFLSSPVLSLRSRLFVCSEAFRTWRAPRDGREPTLERFITERLGAEAARVLGGAFVRGVYAAELGELGAESAMPRMWRAVVEHGSLVRALRAAGKRPELALPGPRVPRTSLLSFPNGLQEIVQALERSLAADRSPRSDVAQAARATDSIVNRLRLCSTAIRVERASRAGVERASGWRVVTANESFEADQLVLAVPAPIAARLLADVAADAVSLDTLRRIVHSRVTLAHLGFERAELGDLPAGFGYLVPPPATDEHRDRGEVRASSAGARSARASSEDPLVLGTIFASNLFAGRAPEGCAAVTSFYKSDDVERMDEKEISAQACRDLALALRRSIAPRARVAVVQRWEDVIPHYAPGHAQRMRELLLAMQDELPGVHLAGSYVAGVSVDDVIARGRAVAAAIMSGDSVAREATSAAASSSAVRADARRANP